MKKVSLITLTVFTFISLFWTDANAQLATANSSSGTTAAAAVTEFCARSAITGECVTPTTNSISIPVDDTTDDAADDTADDTTTPLSVNFYNNNLNNLGDTNFSRVTSMTPTSSATVSTCPSGTTKSSDGCCCINN